MFLRSVSILRFGIAFFISFAVFSAALVCLSVKLIILTCVGESQVGKEPDVSSRSMPMNRSMDP